MNLSRFSAITATALLIVVGSFTPAGTARAGDVSNAELGCYVDTYAYDYPTIGGCIGYWTPSTADNPSVAVFEVSGLPAGNYSFYWTDLLTGQSGICSTSSPWCTRTISVNGIKRLRVIVIDNQTGASKTLIATARYFDGWN